MSSVLPKPAVVLGTSAPAFTLLHSALLGYSLIPGTWSLTPFQAPWGSSCLASRRVPGVGLLGQLWEMEQECGIPVGTGSSPSGVGLAGSGGRCVTVLGPCLVLPSSEAVRPRS